MSNQAEVLWKPSDDFMAASNLTRFRQWLSAERALEFGEYEELWAWSVRDLEGFWSAVWSHFDIQSNHPYRQVVSGPTMSASRWFEGAEVNYAEHVLRHEAISPSAVALHHSSEIRSPATLSWAELGGRVRSLAERLRSMGLQPGDRVVSYMPNIPETVIAMLAVTAVGGVWAAAAPEFGAPAVIARFAQLAPKMAIVADGYVFAGQTFDRRVEITQIAEALPSITHIIWLPYVGFAPPALGEREIIPFDDLLTEVSRTAAFCFERVASDHPLWVLFSSGTTGKPKAIIHSHVGIVAEHLKYTHLHLNLKRGDCMFFYTTTGWMIWNTLVSALMAGAACVLYDGSPTLGGADRLWRIAMDTGATLLGASPTLVHLMQRAGVRPQDQFDLGRLESIVLSGAPSSPDIFRWFYADVKSDLWVTSQSGGTELCSGLVGGVCERPVRAGEIQGRMLGMDVRAWSDDKRDLTDAFGELVVTKPFPSMPLGFWGDIDGRAYRETYFNAFPNVWRHGDLICINDRGGCFISGRSDATLNRFGVRVGAAEIYNVLGTLDCVTDSLVVSLDLPGGASQVILFVVLAPGTQLDDDTRSLIRAALREQASPRHVPDVIVAAPSIPYTLTGKKMEIPVRRLLAGARLEVVASRDAMTNPDSLNWFAEYANRSEIRGLMIGMTHG